MSAESTLPRSEDHSATPDEKRLAFSNELTSPEHAALEMKNKSKGIHAFPSWSKKAPQEGHTVQAAETPVSVSFFSLFRLVRLIALVEW